MAESDSFLETAQKRLIREMEEISHEDEAGSAVKNLVTSTATLVPLITSEFLPEADAAIYSKARLQKLLQDFGERLLETQVEWANRWNRRRD